MSHDKYSSVWGYNGYNNCPPEKEDLEIGMILSEEEYEKFRNDSDVVVAVLYGEFGQPVQYKVVSLQHQLPDEPLSPTPQFIKTVKTAIPHLKIDELKIILEAAREFARKKENNG